MKATEHSVRKILGDNFHSQVYRGLPEVGQVKGREQGNCRGMGEMSCLRNREKTDLYFSNNKMSQLRDISVLGSQHSLVHFQFAHFPSLCISKRQMVYDCQAIRKTANSRKLGGVKSCGNPC